MRFTVTGIDQLSILQGRFRTAIRDLPDLIAQALRETGQESVKALQEATPLGTGRTGGHLRESYYTTESTYLVTVNTNQPKKLAWVRYGTGIYGAFAHPIVPTHAAYLWSEELSHPMRSVRGQRPHDFVQPVMDDVQTYLNEAVKPMADQLMLILEGG